MKKIYLPLFSSFAALCPIFAEAATEYYFVPESADDLNWGLLANWRTSDDGGQTLSPAESLPGASDAVVFDQSKLADLWPDGTGMGWYMNGDIQTGAVTITGNLAGLAFSSYNLELSKRCKLPIVPTDLFPRDVSDITKVPYSRIKIGFDVTCLMVTALLTFFGLGRIEGLGIGTVAAAFTMGKGIVLMGKLLDKKFAFVSVLSPERP